VLILTDAFGSTPSNIAHRIAQRSRANVISGVNLPMLIRIFNYCSDSLDSLTQKAAEGGIRGIQVSLAREGDDG
jgi:PTS system ascorbate-specific IIA component